MKKFMTSTLYLILALVLAVSVYAHPKDSPNKKILFLTEGNGMTAYYDSTTLKHVGNEIVKYTGIIELHPGSETFYSVYASLENPALIPTMIMSVVYFDCAGSRIKVARTALGGYNREAEDPSKFTLLYSEEKEEEFSEIQWREIKELDLNAKERLCGKPS